MFYLQIFSKLWSITELCNQPVDDDKSETDSDKPADTSTDTKDKPSKTTLQSLQQDLLQKAKQKKKLTRYEALRKETLDYLDTVFR